MPSTNLKIDFVSTQQSQKEVTLNVAIQTLDTAVAGRLVKDLGAAPAAVALTVAEAMNPYLAFTGAPAQAVEITVPATARMWVVHNALTGSNTGLTLKTAAGAAIAIAAGSKTVVFCDGGTVSFLGSQALALGDLQAAVSGRLVKDLASSGANTVLSAAEAQNAFLTLTGAPVAGTVITVPAAAHFWLVDSRTTGANATISMKTASGVAISVASGQVLGVYCDGTSLTVVSDATALTARVAALESAASTGGSAGGRLVKDLSSLGATVVLTAAEAANSQLSFTGTSANAVVIVVPASARSWTLENKTMGSVLTVKTPSGAGVVLPVFGPTAPYTVQAYSDGTDVKPLASSRATFHARFAGKPTGGQAIAGYISSGKTMLPKLSVNQLRAATAPAGAPGFYLRKVSYSGSMPGTSVGGFQLQSGSTYTSFSSTADVTLNDGDFLYLDSPATADTALADLFLTLNFVRLD